MSRDANGTTSIANAASPGAFDNMQPLTVMGWFSFDGAGEAQSGRLVCKESNATAALTGPWFLTALTSPATCLQFRKDETITNLLVRTASGTVRTDGSFQHIAVSWDGSSVATNVHIYIDGTEPAYQAQTDGAGTLSSDAIYNLNIGNRTGADRTHDGRIADIQIFRRVLSRAEVRQAMRFPGMGSNSLFEDTTAGLIRYYPMHGFSGIEFDATHNGGGITITNLPFHPTHPPVNGRGTGGPIPMPYGAS